MKTVEIKIYKFGELSEDIQSKVLEKHHEINVDYEWYECVYETFKEDYKDSGFNIEKIYFSGFSNQGDGAMFEYSRIDESLLTEFVDSLELTPMRKLWLKSQTIVSGRGKHSGHYYHEKSCNHSINWESNFSYSYAINFHNWIESFAAKFEDFVIEKYMNMCKELYKALEESYDWLTSDEQIKETILSNDYDFTGCGELY